MVEGARCKGEREGGGGKWQEGDAEFGIQKHMEAVRVHRQDVTGLDLIQAHLRW